MNLFLYTLTISSTLSVIKDSFLLLAKATLLTNVTVRGYWICKGYWSKNSKVNVFTRGVQAFQYMKVIASSISGEFNAELKGA